jgi:tripartite-type tricarboxylate transporter receptor subunit TctC
MTPLKTLRRLAKCLRLRTCLSLRLSHRSDPLQNLSRFAKANPKKPNFASSGQGTSVHLSAELFMRMANIEMVHVPYKGTGSAMPDFAHGVQVPTLVFLNLPSASPLVKSGQLRALGVTTAKRSAAASDIPSISEAALPGYEDVHLVRTRRSGKLTSGNRSKVKRCAAACTFQQATKSS